ncbi:MAG: carbon storage regulator CsrA [Bacillota bacterium]|nr:carbon storage regulator CsrA [Bacillota bacterium]MDW7683028.1 carbon storage regulator CsrA [Bacillota bacterium]
MLILTRKAGQNLVIGDNIIIKILDVKGETIKIGIEAPKDVAVNRQEVHEAIKQANRAAALGPKTIPTLPNPK